MKEQKIRIVVTDGYTLNPGDLSWDPLRQLGELHLYERSAPEVIEERCREATIIVTNKTPISREVIKAAKGLRAIAVTATGYNIVDVKAAAEAGVSVSNVPGYGTDSVAQHAFALLLELVSGVGRNSRSVAEGDWSRSKDFCYSVIPMVELAGKTMGVIGYGTIGRRTAEIGRAFGMNVVYNSPSLLGKDPEAKTVEEIFSVSDVVTLHCPLTSTNAGFVNMRLLSKMKPTAFLVNTARGQLINEGDLAEALRAGMLAGAGLDVLSVEPPPVDHPLVGLKNCVITPHNAWWTIEARRRIMDITVANVKAALSGSPQNLCR